MVLSGVSAHKLGGDRTVGKQGSKAVLRRSHQRQSQQPGWHGQGLTGLLLLLFLLDYRIQTAWSFLLAGGRNTDIGKLFQ